MTSLRELPIGKTATIRSVGGEGALRQHFLDMGLIPKGDVTMVKYAPMGDPMELRIHSYELTLRLADAEKIEIENIRDEVKPYEGKAVHNERYYQSDSSPGLGEAVNIMKRKMNIHCRTVNCLHLLLQAIRIAVRQHCLTSLQVPVSMWEIFRGLL